MSSEHGRQRAVRHIVWDWNGTLCDDASAMIDATIEAFEIVGLPPVTRERYQRLHTQPIDVFYDRLLGRVVPADIRRRLHAAFRTAYARRQPQLTLARGAREALDRASHGGFTQSVLSLYPHDELVELIGRFGIAQRFRRVDGRRGRRFDAKATALVEHLRRLDINGAEALLIGDSVDDARAAVAVGARCVLYGSGLHTHDALEAEGVPVTTTLPDALDLGVR